MRKVSFLKQVFYFLRYLLFVGQVKHIDKMFLKLDGSNNSLWTIYLSPF